MLRRRLFCPRDLSMVTELGDIVVVQGKYTVSIGGGQTDTGVPSISGSLEVNGQIILPEQLVWLETYDETLRRRRNVLAFSAGALLLRLCLDCLRLG